MTLSWQKRRTSFNHDWLKNQYMPALAKCINIVDGKIEDRAFELNFYNLVLRQWKRHEVELSTLLDDFKSARNISSSLSAKYAELDSLLCHNSDLIFFQGDMQFRNLLVEFRVDCQS